MSEHAARIMLPARLHTSAGHPRHIGIELEMSGLSIDQLATTVADELNLTIEESSRYQYTLKGDDDGDWLVELDFQMLKKMGEEKRDAKSIGNDIESLLHLVAKPLVPHELVSPPLVMERLPEMENLVARLRDAGAKGTSESVLNAFSMQLNPEAPALDSTTILAYLKAFLCLYDWLYEEASINMTRRITTYVDPFPKKYLKKVLPADYWPDSVDSVISDYLQHNATRNRALDMLPLFSHLNDSLVQQYTKDPLIKSRPAFHYRLPNCEIHLPEWGIYKAWQGWLQIEALANDQKRLNACSKAYLRWLNAPWWRRMLSPQGRTWNAQLRNEWLINLDN